MLGAKGENAVLEASELSDPERFRGRICDEATDASVTSKSGPVGGGTEDTSGVSEIGAAGNGEVPRDRDDNNDGKGRRPASLRVFMWRPNRPMDWDSAGI